MAQGSSWLFYEHYLLEWFMKSSSHTDFTFTWIVHEQFMWVWYLCGMNYSWTILVNGAHELIMNCPGPWALLWTVQKRKFMNCLLVSRRVILVHTLKPFSSLSYYALYNIMHCSFLWRINLHRLLSINYFWITCTYIETIF